MSDLSGWKHYKLTNWPIVCLQHSLFKNVNKGSAFSDNSKQCFFVFFDHIILTSIFVYSVCLSRPDWLHIGFSLAHININSQGTDKKRFSFGISFYKYLFCLFGSATRWLVWGLTRNLLIASVFHLYFVCLNRQVWQLIGSFDSYRTHNKRFSFGSAF